MLLAIVAVLVLSVLIVIPMVLESSRLRPEVERRLSRTLGRPVLIQGPMRVSLLPRIRLQVSQLRLPEAGGLSGADLMTMETLEAEASIGAFLARGLRPQSMRIRGLHLVLERDSNGEFNWLRRAPTSQESKGPQSSHSKGIPSSRTQLLLPGGLLGTRLDVSDASFLLLDHGLGKQVELRGMNIQVGRPSPDGFQSVWVEGEIQGRPLSARGSVRPPGPDSTKGSMLLDLAFEVGARFKASVRGEIVVSEGVPALDLWLEVEPFSAQALFRAVSLEPPALFSKGWDRVSLRGRLRASRDSLELHQARVEVDQLFFFGVSMALRTKPEPSMELDVEGEELDLDRYISAPTKGGPRREDSKGMAPRAREMAAQAIGARAWLPGIPCSGAVRIRRIGFRGQWMEEVELSYRMRDRVLEFDPIRLRVAQGELWGSGSVDLQGPLPTVHLDLETRGVQVGLLLDRMARTRFLDGVMESHWVLEGPWEGDLDRVVRTWKGEADVVLTDGAINGADLMQMARTFGLGWKKATAEGIRARTPFSRLVAHVAMADGVVRVSRASMQNRELRILAAGQASLVERSMDFRLEPELGSGRDEGGTATLVVPFWVEGSFSHPKFRPDLAGIRKKGEGKLHLTLPSSRELKEALRNLLKGK